ncbi:Tubulin/FtsZ family, GTPase domain containing protein [Trichomonas vaginalis G3]|uniref:Tubulin delta chain n=1 Tax=Trichomonas vaginalis (strain ATCC PRA-98 / G3) TaxID=412133 RepID=A2F2M2_TRIV3|nr:delta zeta tubulin-like domain-containing protein [Trichomonas vaginalis G3]EAY00856.1 Tubulin/FtsZ family, GTPase domain containing protein [Trichomonas vaginalis G3]KAI5544614.1 delta zeta tubulin-like domain-containing protein [Trichomonas vaginalis G3]|eukprot:XP_001313785.1 Tubulin/FtsZ family, GTPase domain containing protein [Trichomonas vaginalis G3]
MTQLIACGVGQCGVQMASSFTETYMKEAQNYVDQDAFHRLFYETSDHQYIARTVLIDTERKAITDILSDKFATRNWKYDKCSIWAEGCGSGNNWAYGYDKNGFAAKNEVMDRLQHQAEKCDRFGGFLFFQSLGGGTGSGLGSRITECVRDTFGPRAQIVNNVVWPYTFGGVMVQNYNSVLSLAALIKNSDAVVVTYNDTLHAICAAQKGPENVTLADMNDVFSRNLAGLLLPSYELCTVPIWSQPLSHLVQIPTRRLLHIFGYPIESDVAHGFSNYNWSSLIDNVLSMVATGNFVGRSIRQIRSIIDPRRQLPIKKCDAIWTVFRGIETNQAKQYMLNHDIMKCQHFFPADNDDPLLVSTSTRKFLGYDQYTTVMANSQVIIDPLEDLLQKFHNMIETGAYIHQYLDTGMEKSKLQEDKLFLEQVLFDYKTM